MFHQLVLFTKLHYLITGEEYEEGAPTDRVKSLRNKKKPTCGPRFESAISQYEVK